MEALHSDDIDIWYHGCFRDIRFGEEYILISELSCEDSRRKGSLDRAYHTIECELTKKEGFRHDRVIEVILFPEYSECYRKVIDRSLLLEICRSEIDRDTSSTREGVSTIFERTSHSLSTLLYGSISESDDREVAHTSDDIDLYFDEVSTDTCERRREEFLHRSKWVRTEWW